MNECDTYAAAAVAVAAAAAAAATAAYVNKHQWPAMSVMIERRISNFKCLKEASCVQSAV